MPVSMARVGVSLKWLTTNFLTPRERIEHFSSCCEREHPMLVVSRLFRSALSSVFLGGEERGEGALYECIDVPSTPASKMRALFLHLLLPSDTEHFISRRACARSRDFFSVSFHPHLHVRIVKMRRLALRYGASGTQCRLSRMFFYIRVYYQHLRFCYN